MSKVTRTGREGFRQQTWHGLRAEEALAAVASHADRGLTAEEARRRLERFGANELPAPARRSLLGVFASQFKSPLIYLLIGAAAIALFLGHHGDACVIAVVVLLNALVGAVQEGRAERSLEALRKLATSKARIVRDGREQVIEAREVVPGDVIIIEAGDAIPADARVLHDASLQIAEAALTGESVPVTKSLLPLASDTPLGDRQNMIYAGTHVTAGRARAVVVASGLDTEIGRIAKLTESSVASMTPLEKRIAQFGRYLILFAMMMFVIVVATGLARKMAFGEIVMIAMSQVVGMIPEGLPVAMTIALAVGVQRMARRNAVVRRLAAVETLGSTTVICTDKTGTLTRNEMTVTALCLPDGREVNVSGVGYAPIGAISDGSRTIDAARDVGIRELLEAAALCNDAQLQGPVDSEPRWRAIGDPTEVALLTLAVKGGIVPRDLRARNPRRAEIPFDSAAKMMATQHDVPSGSRVIVKGAPEIVLGFLRDTGDGGQMLRLMHSAAQRMAERALRVLAVGVVDGVEIDGRTGLEVFHGRIDLLGLVGQIDPPRPEARAAVLRCRAAGIRPVMVTGDHKATAVAIGTQLGIFRDGDVAIDGHELDRMTAAELRGRLGDIAVFARVHPAQKLRIVTAYQERREIVAMTGDGVNDAPALVQADVGVAMGVSGTEVAKESAKVVLGDDDFATIVSAVEEGRVVYRNLKKAVLLLLSTSAAEVLVLLAALLLGYPAPYAAVQILWNNLVTEGLITINLVMEPPEGDEMTRLPTPVGEPLVTRAMLARMAIMVPAIMISTLGWFIVRTEMGVVEAQVRTETFTLLAICEWFNVLNCRAESKSAFSLGLLRNPWLLFGLAAGNVLQLAVVFWTPLAKVFHTVPFSMTEVVALGIVGSLVLWVEELRKLVQRVRRGDAGAPAAAASVGIATERGRVRNGP